jgi:hypothetical protein
MKTSALTALALASLLLFAIAPPTYAVEGRASTITFLDDDDDQHIRVFVKGDNGHLVSRSYDGHNWSWIDHGLPAGATFVSNPQAITYVDETGRRRIYVFAVTDDKRLVVRFHKGAGYAWQWADQGGRYVLPINLAATTFLDDAGVRHIFAFVIRNDDQLPSVYLYARHWNGSEWAWEKLEVDGATQSWTLAFTTPTHYIDNAGHRRLDLFTDTFPYSTLHRYSWYGGAWHGTDLGGNAIYHAAAVNFLDDNGNRRVHTFVRNLMENSIWDYSGGWSEVGVAPGIAGQPWDSLSATAYYDLGFNPHMNVYADWDGQVRIRSWGNTGWSPWTNPGLPSNSNEGVRNIAAIAYYEPVIGLVRHFVTATGAQKHLFVLTASGSTWQWTDHGNP